MSSADVFAQIQKMGELPSLPRTLLAIQKVASDDRSSANDLAECILTDQALTMRVLKVVNSVLYRRSDDAEVRTVHKAVVRMGFETVRSLALGLSVFDMMSKLSRSPWLLEIARHSLVTAGFAQLLAESSGRVPPAEAFVTALIHDIGKVVLIECDPAAMDEVMKDTRAAQDTLDAERRHFGITHDRAGRRLGARWGLPQDMLNVIGDHHDIDPLEPPRQLDGSLAVIVYANAMAGFTCEAADLDRERKVMLRAGQTLGISRNRVEDIHLQASDLIDELARAVGLQMDDLKDYGSLVNAEGSVTVAPDLMTPEEMVRRTVRQLELYRAVGAGLAEGRDSEELLGMILEGAAEILGFARVVLLKADRDRHELRPWAWSGAEAEELAFRLRLPLSKTTGALALAVLEQRSFHVPMAGSPAYGAMAGTELLAVARCTGYVAAPVRTPDGVVGVIYADDGPGGSDVVAEQASELVGLAQQAGLVVGGAAAPV